MVLTANPSKCLFNRPKIDFFGLIFSEAGTTPSKEKINALQDMNRPTSGTEVRSFLGMANFSCHFIPNYSDITHPLRELTKKNRRFEWTTQCQEAFDTIRNALSEHSLNAYFDPERNTKVIVDGSKKDGLGCMLAQENPDTRLWEVIRYDSRPVTPVERHYSQLEIESASIEWANRKNRIYLYGLSHYEISTDHKPLVPLYNSYKNEMPPRVMKHKMNMQGYSYTVIHEPGESNPSDYLSRHPQRTLVPAWTNKIVDETELFINAVVNANLPDALTTKEVQEATEIDSQMQDLKVAITKGYMSRQHEETLRQFKHILEELSFHDNMVVRGHRLVIPASLQEKAVKLAHEAHQGLVKSKNYLRSRIWFPGMDSSKSRYVWLIEYRGTFVGGSMSIFKISCGGDCNIYRTPSCDSSLG